MRGMCANLVMQKGLAMNPKLLRLIDRHKGIPWRGSDVLALATTKLMEAMNSIMQMNKPEEMRVIAAKVTNDVNGLVGEEKPK